MDFKKSVWNLLAAVILAAGIITAAALLPDRAVVGSFSGSVYSPGEGQEIMSIYMLRDYLGLSPGDVPSEEAEKALIAAMEKQIRSGGWPGFPCIYIGDEPYFSKEAVDEWFAERSLDRPMLPLY